MFQKGQPKKGGRQKGTANKLTTEQRKTLAAVLDGQIEKIPQMLSSLESDPQTWVLAISRLLPYVYPKKQSVAFNDVTDAKKSIRQRLDELNDEADKTIEEYKQKLLANTIINDG